MSYDVYLESPGCPTCKSDPKQLYDANMTSNVSGIWYRALMAALGKTVPENWGSGSFGGAPHPLSEVLTPDAPDQWDSKLGAFGPLVGMTGGDAILVLEKAARHIDENRDAYRKFEPNNNWGDAPGAARFLRQLAAAWKDCPTATLRVSR